MKGIIVPKELYEQTEGLSNEEYLSELEQKFDILERMDKEAIQKYIPSGLYRKLFNALFIDGMPGVDAYGEALEKVQEYWPVNVEHEDGDLMALVEDDRFYLTYLDKQDFRKIVFFAAQGLEILPERPTREEFTRLLDIVLRAEDLYENNEDLLRIG